MKNLMYAKEAVQQDGECPTPRQPYEPPKATFVPLKVEERLLFCTKPDVYCPIDPSSS